MLVGDVVLIHYVGKSKPGNYRMGGVVEAEEDSDGCVRTVIVEYSLISELSEEERKLYKGVTKKRIEAPVQRLVLILPVEEQTDREPVISEVPVLSRAATSCASCVGDSQLTGVFRRRLETCSVIESRFKCIDFDTGLYSDFVKKLK